jgi:hypothetical protein
MEIVACATQSVVAQMALRPQPVCDLAFNPEAIKFRLQGIPVYALVNKQNSLVLVGGEVRVDDIDCSYMCVCVSDARWVSMCSSLCVSR